MFLFSGSTNIFSLLNILSLHLIEPLSGFFKPDNMFNKVDLPIPLAPATRPTSFFSILKSKFSTKRLLLKEKAKFFTSKHIFI